MFIGNTINTDMTANIGTIVPLTLSFITSTLTIWLVKV